MYIVIKCLKVLTYRKEIISIKLYVIFIKFTDKKAEMYSEPSQTSKMECFVKIFNG